jgi:HK97 family phage prohead protease
MNTKRMTCRAFIKSVDETNRTVEQIVSVFGNVDYGGDRVVAGAFKGSLERWTLSGDPIPAIWSHTWDDPFAHIGAVLEARELEPGNPALPTEIADLGGLYVKYRVDDKPFAGQVFDLLKERRVREASFAYDVLKERRAADGANDLLELDLIEVGPTLKGMNPMTQLLSMKNVREALTAELGAGWNVAGKTEEEVDAAVLRALEKAGVVPHTFIAGDDDRCTLCGLTRNTVGHMNVLGRDAGGEKAWVNVTGSIEEILQQVYEAAFEWAAGGNMGNGGFYTCYLEATFPNENPVRAIVLVEGWDDPYGEGEFFEAKFAANDAGDGLVVDGDPAPVEIQGVVAPKARRKALSRTARGDGSSPPPITPGSVKGGNPKEPKGKAEDPSGGKAEDSEATRGAENGTTPARALAEIDLLELT